MAGHSKFKNIMHRKGRQDAKRAKVFAKLGKELSVAARGGTDPDFNPRLRLAIAAAKAQNMPNDNIQRSIKRAEGDNSVIYEEVRYEGYGPGNCMVIVDCLTDNPNRTFGDVRLAFTKTKCKIGTPGAVAHMFDHCAIFAFAGQDEEAVLEALMEADVDVTDIESEDGKITVFTPNTEYAKAKQALEAAFEGIEFDVDEIQFLPKTTTVVEGDDIPMFEKFLDMLNDLDDVQNVFHNAELPQE